MSVYFTVEDVNRLAQNSDLFDRMALFDEYLHVGRVYLETFRSGIMASDDALVKVKQYFTQRGIRVSGGITPTRPDKAFWQLLCYNSPDDVALLESAVRRTAAHFDDFILDDFFYTDCRCPACCAAKGDEGFAAYRLDLMARVSNKVISVARQVNPNAKAIIKFPNWYPSYSFTGYNPQVQRKIFDGVHTGTETRNRLTTQQSLPRYVSYAILRYMENIAPGKNGGGWFDSFDCPSHRDYVEQGVLTLLAGAKEITLFCFGYIQEAYLPVLGHQLKVLDHLLGQLGQPVGVSCYLPFNAFGENYLAETLGMIGIPVEPMAEYDARPAAMLLTEAASVDADIVRKMERLLGDGKTVITTAGFWKNACDLGGEVFRWTGAVRKAHRLAMGIHDTGFKHYYDTHGDLLFPEITCPTNDAWAVVAGMDRSGAFPILIKQMWGNGTLYVLNIPCSPYDITTLPVPVLDEIRQAVCASLPVSLRGDAEVGLFVYDNQQVVVYSFADVNSHGKICDATGEVVAEVELRPGEMQALSLQKSF